MTRRIKVVYWVLSAFLACGVTGATCGPRAAKALGPRLDFDRSGHILAGGGASNTAFWAWERPEDFRFLEPDKAHVAFLAKTIYLQPAASSPNPSAPPFLVRPRFQPLRIAPGTPLIAVVRIENPGANQHLSFAARLEPVQGVASFCPDQREALASEIAALQSIPGVSGVQIDFDATVSEHAFYAALLQDVRRKLPRSMPLSITALASWCIGDPWLAQLPAATIDEAVPMLFRMGADSANVATFLRSGKEFPVAACQGSLGLSNDEAFSRAVLTGKVPSLFSAQHRKRVYVFAPRAWTEAAAEKVFRELPQ